VNVVWIVSSLVALTGGNVAPGGKVNGSANKQSGNPGTGVAIKSKVSSSPSAILHVLVLKSHAGTAAAVADEETGPKLNS
jgi:hypothetical protein